MSKGSAWNSWYPPAAAPRPVDDGVKARSKRGAIGQSWWSERFISVLENIGVGTRLQRGRNYARKGQVISFELSAGIVTAQVQGSRSRPYRVRIGITPFGKADWATLEHELADNAWYLAKLLAGEMPEDIETVFDTLGLALFPSTAKDLSLDCTCPDWEVPCKHLAAVFYLLAEAFDADPFAILAWRGREREDLLDNLRAARNAGHPAADLAESHGPPLHERLDTFYALQGELPLTTPHPLGSDALLNQLPPVNVKIRGKQLTDLLRSGYQTLGSHDFNDGEPQ